MCTNQELQDQITKLAQESKKRAKKNDDVHNSILKTLKEWTPLIKCYEQELTRAKAYKLVADDWKDKGGTFKFWASLVAVILSIFSAIFVIIEKTK